MPTFLFSSSLLFIILNRSLVVIFMYKLHNQHVMAITFILNFVWSNQVLFRKVTFVLLLESYASPNSTDHRSRFNWSKS